MKVMENFESLWKYCQKNNRAIPKDWNRLYNKLKNKRQKSSGGWEPSLPLILAAWHETMPIEKQLRFREHPSGQKNKDKSRNRTIFTRVTGRSMVSF